MVFSSMAVGQHDIFMFVFLTHKLFGYLDSFVVCVNFMIIFSISARKSSWNFYRVCNESVDSHCRGWTS